MICIYEQPRIKWRVGGCERSSNFGGYYYAPAFYYFIEETAETFGPFKTRQSAERQINDCILFKED